MTLMKPGVKGRLNQIQSDLAYLLGRPVDLSTYAGRMQFQKLTYLLQKWGLDYSYWFSWHYAGPFSAQLHSDYYSAYMKAQPDRAPRDPGLLAEFKRVFAARLDDLDQLELIASVLFLDEEYACQLDKSKLVEIMALRKPKFSSDQVGDAIRFLKSTSRPKPA